MSGNADSYDYRLVVNRRKVLLSVPLGRIPTVTLRLNDAEAEVARPSGRSTIPSKPRHAGLVFLPSWRYGGMEVS
jgi:hypothetical protein